MKPLGRTLSGTNTTPFSHLREILNFGISMEMFWVGGLAEKVKPSISYNCRLVYAVYLCDSGP